MRAAILGVVIGTAALAFSDAANAEEGNGLGFTDSQTQRAASVFEEGAAGCMAAPVVYRADCFQAVFGNTAAVINKASAYWEAEVALTRVNRNLYTFVRNNTDKAQSKIKVNSARVKAVTAGSMPEARALFTSSVDKAVEVMLSGSASETRYFKPIADVVAKYRDALS